MLIPTAARVAVLVNPTDRANAETVMRDLDPAARTIGLQVQLFEARTSSEIDAAFASIARTQPDALFVAGQTYFNSRRIQLVHLASYYRLPATYGSRAYPDAGGLMSYGADVTDAYRQAGRLYRPHTQGREARRLADRPAIKIPAGHQRADCSDARPHRAAGAARHRRRGDRMMRRREFITLLGGAAAAWPLAARAQQPAMPVIGFLNSGSPDTSAKSLAAFHHGLAESGYVEGRNASMQYRWAEGQYERLPAMAADLVRNQVAVLLAGGPPAVHAARSATTTVPIVFTSGETRSRRDLSIASTGRVAMLPASMFLTGLEPKRLGLLREVVPQAEVIAVLVNPEFPRCR